jgi:hypothetical protein
MNSVKTKHWDRWDSTFNDVKKKHILFKIMVFLNVMLCSLVDGSIILEKPAASIFYPKNGGSRFFQKVGMLVSTSIYQIILQQIP